MKAALACVRRWLGAVLVVASFSLVAEALLEYSLFATSATGNSGDSPLAREFSRVAEPLEARLPGGSERPSPMRPRNADTSLRRRVWACDRFPRAPRTHPGAFRGEDLVKERRHAQLFVFQPSGGFNNQRIILERALHICKMLNRVCVVPLAARHSSMYANYNKMLPEDLIEMDRVLDFARLRAYGAKIAPLSNTTLPVFLEELRAAFPDRKDWLTIEQTRQERKENPITMANFSRWAQNPAKIIYFAGPTMWQRFTKHFESDVHPFVRYAPFFRAVALDAVEALRLGRNYICVHSRQGDHGEKWERWMAKKDVERDPASGAGGGLPGDAAVKSKFAHANGFSSQYLPSEDGLVDPGSFILSHVRNALVQHVLPQKHLRRIYVATKPSANLTYYANLTSVYETWFSRDIPRPLMRRFNALFDLPEQARLANDMLGIVEQLICARSYLYIGFKGSSFSEYISRMRDEPIANLDP